VGTVPKSNRKTNNATLSGQFQSPIEKQLMHTVEMFIGLWNCSDHVALFVFLLDFGTAPRMWHYLLLYWILELFRQCGMIGFSMGLCNCSDSVALFVFNFSIGLPEQFQNPIEEQIMPYCRNSIKIQ
jgi:hypothetical protein